MENESVINVRKIVIFSNNNSTYDPEKLLEYFNDNIYLGEELELSIFNYRKLQIDGNDNYLFNLPGHQEFISIKQILSEDVDGVIVFIETQVGIFETDLEVINLINMENIPHVLFANRADLSAFEMNTYVEGELIIPTIAWDGIGINDGLKMLLKLIDKHEQETNITEQAKPEENCESIENYQNIVFSPPFKTEFCKLRFFFHPIELENVKNSLKEFGFSNITIIDIKYRDSNNDKMETYRTSSYELELPPKMEIMMIIKKEEINYVVQALEAAKTGNVSEKLFISPVEQVIRIRTTEKGENAID